MDPSEKPQTISVELPIEAGRSPAGILFCFCFCSFCVSSFLGASSATGASCGVQRRPDINSSSAGRLE